MQRWHNRRAVFVTNQDCPAYLETLREFREALGLKVYGRNQLTANDAFAFEIEERIGIGILNTSRGRLESSHA